MGHVCGLIVRLRLVERGWTTQQLLDRIDRHARDNGIRIADPGDQRDPLGYLAWLIRHALADADVAPFETIALARAHRALAAVERELEDVARRAAISEQSDEIQRIIDAMHSQFPRRPQPGPVDGPPRVMGASQQTFPSEAALPR